MECNKDGSITLVKELSTEFVIPKKKKPNKTDDMDSANYLNNTEPQSVVNNSYQTEYAYNAELKNHQQHCNGTKRTANYKETPKNQESGTKYRDSFGDLHDPSLPEELRKLLQPLFCKVCSSTLNSNLNARMHYTSKNHHRKIKKWLTEHSLVTGEPLHKKALLVEQPKPIDVDPKHFYCEVCDLPLTGRVHAGQHYCGKSHQKALTGKRAPSGKGHYNENGQWIRTIAAKSDTTGRDGFGQGFILAPIDASASVLPSFDGTGSICSKLRCDLCNVAVTSIQQLEVHLVGQKHKKKLKQTQVTAGNTQRIRQVPPTQSQDPSNDLEPGTDYGRSNIRLYFSGTMDTSIMSISSNAYKNELLSFGALVKVTCAFDLFWRQFVDVIGRNDAIIVHNFPVLLSNTYLARFRTPSGQYYCKTCDLSLNSDSQFSMHVQSKKHLKKISILPVK